VLRTIAKIVKHPHPITATIDYLSGTLGNKPCRVEVELVKGSEFFKMITPTNLHFLVWTDARKNFSFAFMLFHSNFEGVKSSTKNFPTLSI
jgi:hypothetical protein